MISHSQVIPIPIPRTMSPNTRKMMALVRANSGPTLDTFLQHILILRKICTVEKKNQQSFIYHVTEEPTQSINQQIICSYFTKSRVYLQWGHLARALLSVLNRNVSWQCAHVTRHIPAKSIIHSRSISHQNEITWRRFARL